MCTSLSHKEVAPPYNHLCQPFGLVPFKELFDLHDTLIKVIQHPILCNGVNQYPVFQSLQWSESIYPIHQTQPQLQHPTNLCSIVHLYYHSFTTKSSIFHTWRRDSIISDHAMHPHLFRIMVHVSSHLENWHNFRGAGTQ